MPKHETHSEYFEETLNAKFMGEQTIVQSFIPMSHFRRLTRFSHSILLGPRGCGKTTLLKMLTRRAIKIWDAERKHQYKVNPFEYPTFEAIYIPCAYGWNVEAKGIASDEPWITQ